MPFGTVLMACEDMSLSHRNTSRRTVENKNQINKQIQLTHTYKNLQAEIWTVDLYFNKYPFSLKFETG